MDEDNDSWGLHVTSDSSSSVDKDSGVIPIEKWFGSSTSSEGDEHWRDVCSSYIPPPPTPYNQTDEIMDGCINNVSQKRSFVADEVVKRNGMRGTDNTGIFGEAVAFLFLMQDYLTNRVPDVVQAKYVTQNVFNQNQLLLIAPRALVGWMSGSTKLLSFEELVPDDLELSLFVVQWLNDGANESGYCWDMAMFYFKQWEQQPNFIEGEGMGWEGYFQNDEPGSGLAKTLGRLRPCDIKAGVVQYEVNDDYEIISQKDPDVTGICPVVGKGDIVCLIEVKSTSRSDSFIIHMSYNQMLLMSRYQRSFLLLCVQDCPTLFSDKGDWSSIYNKIGYTIIFDPLSFFDEKMTIYKRELKLRYKPEPGAVYEFEL